MHLAEPERHRYSVITDKGGSGPLTVLTAWKESDTFTREYVMRLREGVAENLSIPHRFVVMSPHQVDDCEWMQIPEWPDGHFIKVHMFSPELTGRILYIDLSSVITGSLDEMASQTGVCITRDFYHGTPSQSVLLYSGGDFSEVWDGFWKNPEHFIETGKQMSPPDFGDQVLMNRLPTPPMRYWQDVLPGQLVSWKADCARGVPENARIVKFHGRPRPHDVGWLAQTRFEERVNTTEAVRLSHVNANLGRGLPTFQGQSPHDRVMAMVGGGPSLNDTAELLRNYADRTDVDVFALNNAHDWLIQRGITPRFCVMLDARQENAEFVRNPSKDVTYLIAAMCHPDVFDALEGYRVITWVPLMNCTKEMPRLTVGGGGTVGMKAMYLAYIAGYQKFSLFGMDSSYREGSHHAYEQELNDNEDITTVWAGDRAFVAANWMVKQATEFQAQTKKLLSLGCSVDVYGDGLIPHVARMMNAR